MTTNRERITAMEEFRRRHPRKHDRDMDGIAVAVATLLVVVAAICLAVVIAIGLKNRAAEGPYRSVSDIVADCQAQGKVAHVDRDSKHVLSVLCDVR